MTSNFNLSERSTYLTSINLQQLRKQQTFCINRLPVNEPSDIIKKRTYPQKKIKNKMYSGVFSLGCILPVDIRRHIQAFLTNPVRLIQIVLDKKHFEYRTLHYAKLYVTRRIQQMAERHSVYVPHCNRILFVPQNVVIFISQQCQHGRDQLHLDTFLKMFCSRNFLVRMCYHRPFLRELVKKHGTRQRLWNY